MTHTNTAHPRCKITISDIYSNEDQLETTGFEYSIITGYNIPEPNPDNLIHLSILENERNAIRGLNLDIMTLERVLIQCRLVGELAFKNETSDDDKVKEELAQFQVKYRYK